MGQSDEQTILIFDPNLLCFIIFIITTIVFISISSRIVFKW